MAQHDYIIDNQTFPATRTDLNNVFAAIVSQNSGATAPSTTYAYMLWYDTTTDILKMRNANDDAWVDLFTIDQIADTATPSSGAAAAAAGSNLILNGSMQIAQRGVSGTMTIDNQYLSLDRWGTRTYGGSGRFSVAQDTTVPFGQTFTKSLKATVTTTTTSGTYGYAIKHNLEGYTVNQLRTGTSDALKSTLSFWARSSIAGTYCCSVRGTSGAASYVFEYTLAANTWTKIEHTIAEPTTTTPSWDRTNAADFLLEWSLGGQTSKQTSTTESWHDGNYNVTANQTD